MSDEMLNPPDGQTSCLDCGVLSEYRRDNVIPGAFVEAHQGHRLVRRLNILDAADRLEMLNFRVLDAAREWYHRSDSANGEESARQALASAVEVLVSEFYKL